MIAIAQPTLPSITDVADKGVVLLSWDCQYSGVKAISVLRSSDSESNYANIGYVKNTGKGIQAYVDGHPAPGKNYYKLSIVFRTGLTWSSDHCGVYVDKLVLESSKVLLPSNDSLQHFIVTQENSGIQKKTTITDTPVPPAKNGAQSSETKQPKISISFDASDTTQPGLVTNTETTKPTVQHKAITISFDDPDAGPPTFIKSRFIFTDVLSGHVNMNLPNDVDLHHYSVKFYDQKNHVIIEVPRIKVAKSIIDKRNFQHKGLYKFILRKDVTELETGYITIY